MNKLIKNYTTDIQAEKTIAEIQTILSKNGATGIALEYKDGVVINLFFKINLNGKELPFRLPAKPQSVYDALFSNMPGNYEGSSYYRGRMEKSVNIAWRICKLWIEAQITLVNLEQAKIEEVFLPYLVMPGNKTLYEVMNNNQFLLPSAS